MLRGICWWGGVEDWGVWTSPFPYILIQFPPLPFCFLSCCEILRNCELFFLSLPPPPPLTRICHSRPTATGNQTTCTHRGPFLPRGPVTKPLRPVTKPSRGLTDGPLISKTIGSQLMEFAMLAAMLCFL